MTGRHRAPDPQPPRDRRSAPSRPGARLGIALAAIAVIAAAAVYAGHDEKVGPPVVAGTPLSPQEQLHTSFDELGLALPVGVAITPVGGGATVLLGDQSALDAWSTIKIPLALAAERRHGANRSETKAIIDSDNRSARLLTRLLGTPDEAVRAVTRVLREGGDPHTVVRPAGDDAQWPHLGETVWALADSAAWTAHLPCLSGSAHVLDLMSHVATAQNWGLRKTSGDAAVKGGWGAEPGAGRLVRQIGILTLDDRTRVAVSMGVAAPKMSFEQGVGALNAVGRWLGRERSLLPGGSCPVAAGR